MSAEERLRALMESETVKRVQDEKPAGPTLLPAGKFYDLVGVKVGPHGELHLSLDNHTGEDEDLIISIASTADGWAILPGAVEEAYRLAKIAARRAGEEI